MVSHLFLGISLLGAQVVLYLLVFLSIVSLGLIIERLSFYRKASKGLREFRLKIRSDAENDRWEEIRKDTEARMRKFGKESPPDMDTGLVLSLVPSRRDSKNAFAPKVLEELARDGVLRAKLAWEQNLVFLATIGSNAPFIGLFGTVLGIIKAFHNLSEQTGSAAPAVTAGISEALVATAIGILVAIPAVVAFNLFQRRIKSAMSETEALKSFLVAKMLS